MLCIVYLLYFVIKHHEKKNVTDTALELINSYIKNLKQYVVFDPKKTV